MNATRERKIEYINSFGPRAFRTLLTEMICIEGDDFLTDEQIDRMVSKQVEDARRSQHHHLRQRPALRAKMAAIRAAAPARLEAAE